MLKQSNARTILKTRSWLAIGAVAMSLAVGLYFSRVVSANNVTWNGGGATNNWSDAANWSGGTVPGAGDVAVFDGTSTKDATIDAAFAGSVAGIEIDSGYTGTITHASGATFTVGGSGFVQSAGSFTGGVNNIDCNSTFALSGGTFNAPSGILTFSSNVTIAVAATFNPNGGTVAFSGNSGTSLTLPASLTLNNVTVNKTNNVSVSFNSTSTLVASGTLTLTDGKITINNGGTIDAQGPVSIASTFDGGDATLLISGAGTRTVTLPAGATLPAMTVNAPNVTLNTSGAPGTITFSGAADVQNATSFTNGAVNFVFSLPVSLGALSFTAGSGDVTCNSSFTQSGGTFTAGSGALNFNSTFALTGGTFNAPSGILNFFSSVTVKPAATFNPNGGTVAFAGSSSDINPANPASASLTLNNITFNKTNNAVFTLNSTTLVATGTLTLTDGKINENNGGTIDAQGAVSIASTFDGGDATLLISGAATRTVTLPAGATLPGLTVNAPNVTLDTSGAPGTVTFNRAVDVMSAASFTNGAVNLLFNSNSAVVFESVNFTLGSGDLTCDSTFTQTGGTFTQGSGALNFNSTFSVTGGTFNAPSGILTFFSNVTIGPAATFNTNGGTLAFAGSSPTSLFLPASLTLNNVTVNKADGVAVRFQSDSTLVASGTLSLTDGRITVNNGSTIDAQGAVTIASTFDGGTNNLSFSGSANQTFINNGGVNPTGTWTVNKSSGKVTLASNLILIDSQALNITSGTLDQGASFNVQTSNTLTIGAAGTLRDFGTGDLTLGGNLINNGIFNFNGGGTNCGDPNIGDQILFRSSLSGTTRAWSGSGTFSVVDVDVQDQDATAIAGGITAFGSSSVNNSPGWITDPGCPISVTTQPTNASACPGSSATFTVGVSGPGPTFQWRKNSVNLSNGGNISGANSATLTINPVSGTDVASYDAIGTNSFGVTATSPSATLSLLVAPTVSSNPGDATVCENATASFSAAASGSPSPTIQWQVSTDGGATFNNISGATSATLSFTANATQNGNRYRAVFSNTCNTANTTAATLTVNGFALSSGSQTFGSTGGSGSVNVITGGVCSWTALSNDSFIHITSGGGGTGNGTVNFTVDPGSNARTGTMTIAGRTFTVNQSGPTAADGSVNGRILDSSGNPVEGAVIRLDGTQNRKTITDRNGNYYFDGVETNGFYTVTPSRANYNFSPSTRGFSALGAHTEASFNATAGGSHQNPLDTTEYFVRQQYLDFLGREPEEKGLNDWTDTINNCAPGDASCDGVHVSEMFFRSAEFQQRGYFVYRFYSTALDRQPDFAEFEPDLQRVSGFLTNDQLEAAKTTFATDFTSRPSFVNQYATMTNAQYVDGLAQTAGVTLSNRQALVNSLEAGTLTRAQVLRQIAESSDVYQRYYNQAFVVMEYFGYLRRDPDILYLNWIDVLNQGGDSRGMVNGFVNSLEYRQRFGT